MRIKRRESGYWGLISVRFSAASRAEQFSNADSTRWMKPHRVYAFEKFSFEWIRIMNREQKLHHGIGDFVIDSRCKAWLKLMVPSWIRSGRWLRSTDKVEWWEWSEPDFQCKFYRGRYTVWNMKKLASSFLSMNIQMLEQ